MTRGQKQSLVRRGHSWLGWAASILILVVAVSGIALQHPQWLGAPPNEPLCLAVDPADSSHILRGTHWGVEASTDGGLHWQELPMLVAPTDVARILFVSGVDGEEVYALDYVNGFPADMEKYELWVQDSLKKYEAITEPEFNQQF